MGYGSPLGDKVDPGEINFNLDGVPDGTVYKKVTADEKNGLAGTSGTPSGTNKYVTNDDSRNTDERTPSDNSVTAAKLGYAQDAVIFVQHGANAAANGTALKAAYTAAKSLTPGGSALAIDNRAVVVVLAGKYDFGSTAFDVDTDFIDLLGDGICRKKGSEILFPDAKLICDTDNMVVNVTCRDILMQGFHVYHETSGKRGLVIDNANDCDRGRFIDIGVTMQSTSDKAIDDGTNTEIASYFEQCHTLARNIQVGTLSGACIDCTGGDYSFRGYGITSGTFENCTGGDYSFGGGTGSITSGTFENCTGGDYSFGGGTGSIISGTFENCTGGDYSFGGEGGTTSGTFIDCIGGSGSFSGGSNSGTSAIMRRCKSLGRSDAIKCWQGLMEDCEIEVTTAGKHAVELIRDYIGGSARTDNGDGDVDTIVIDGDYSTEFPVGSFVLNSGDSSWYRVAAVDYDVTNAGDTTVTLSTSAASWSGLTVRACSAPRLFNNTLITVDTEAVDTDAESPVLMAHNRMNVAITSSVKNQITTPYEVVDANLVSAFKEL